MANNRPFEHVLALLTGVIRRGKDSGVAHCPAHGDRHQSLSIGVGDDDRVLLHCHAGCRTEAVLEAIGLTLADLFPRRFRDHRRIVRRRPKRAPSARYEYRDTKGVLLAIKERFNGPDGKECFWRRPSGLTGLGDNRVKDLPVYRLPELLISPPDAPVLFVEGEKVCDAVRPHGFTAVSTAGSASQRNFGLSLVPLVGRQVVLCPDNDPPGRVFMQCVAQALLDHHASKPTEMLVRWLEVPNLPPKGDLADYFAAGGTAEMLRQMIATAPMLDSRLLRVRNSRRSYSSSSARVLGGLKGFQVLFPPNVNDTKPQILAAVSSAELTEPEIRLAVGGNQSHTARALRDLVRAGELERAGSGKKGDPYRYRRVDGN